MEDFVPNLTIDEHIELLTAEAVEELFESLAITLPYSVLNEYMENNLTDKLVMDYMDHMDEDILHNHVSTIIDLSPTQAKAKQLAIDNPTQATEVLDELLYWRKQGRI